MTFFLLILTAGSATNHGPARRQAAGDKNIFLVDTTGWVAWADVFPANQHPTVAGHEKIAGEFLAWLTQWNGGRAL